MSWKYDSQRHSLAARGLTKTNKLYKAKLPKVYKESYLSWKRKNQNKLDKVSNEQKELYQSLGVQYRKDIKKQSWFKPGKSLFEIGIKVIPSKDYDFLKQEQNLESRGQMSYAMTVLDDQDKREKIFIRDSGHKGLNKKLLKHEMEEYRIYKQLEKNGVKGKKARDLAHEMTFTKVTNDEVDKAYGDIGDPL